METNNQSAAACVAICTYPCLTACLADTVVPVADFVASASFYTAGYTSTY